MGDMARNRTIHSINDGFELHESQSTHHTIFDHKNRDIGPKKSRLSSLSYLIADCFRPSLLISL
jgi:hypothetical protein